MDDLLEIAAALLPGVRLDRAVPAADGNIHHVLLIPGVAAVRASRRPLAAAAMPRRVEVLRRLASAGLPFQVPEPLTPVTMFGDRAAVAVSWIDGAALPEGVGSVAQIAEVLAAVRAVPLDSDLLATLDGRPEGRHWSEIITADIVPRLPAHWQPEVLRRLDAALALEPVPDALVHGDLGGTNVHWSADGELLGILDWDLAMPGDPALDVAMMAWHGWDTVRRAVPAEVFHRARTWDSLLGVGRHCCIERSQPILTEGSSVSGPPGRPKGGRDRRVDRLNSVHHGARDDPIARFPAKISCDRSMQQCRGGRSCERRPEVCSRSISSTSTPSRSSACTQPS